ncbi:MAG: phage antirepressor KilAC domain-containing protein [Minwuia sp.]|nr:phage antirepressor KilAC domain-containing protein [Minwuia sp.]
MELIKITDLPTAGRHIPTADARELHGYMAVKDDFSTWMKRRIKKYEFTDGVDYWVFSDSAENPSGGRPTLEYKLTLDMAKELAMVENNDKGREARRYFIACEERAKSPPDPVKALNDPAVMRHLLLTYSERVLDLEQDVAELTPKAEALDRIATADGSECITDTAKALGMRPKDLFSWLSGNKWIHRRAGCAHWIAYQDKLMRGLLEHKVTEVTRGDGSTRISEQVRVTAKGIALLAEKTDRLLI